MSDKPQTAFEKYLKHIDLMTLHEDQVLSTHAKNVFECAKKAEVNGLSQSGLQQISELQIGDSEDELALSSINYIHLKLIENAPE